jgi:hypothetical protein
MSFYNFSQVPLNSFHKIGCKLSHELSFNQLLVYFLEIDLDWLGIYFFDVTDLLDDPDVDVGREEGVNVRVES